METITRNDYITYREWHRAVLSGEEVILRNTSALEHLELFVGYGNDSTIDVYAKVSGTNRNVNYHIVESFDGIDSIFIGGLYCTTPSQTFNDMLDVFHDEELSDEQALIMGLADYYYTNGESFNGLVIKEEHAELFEEAKEWALEYYKWG